MALLSEDEKEEIRQSLIEPNEEILSDTATILRETKTPDGRGGTTRSFAETTTSPVMISRDTPRTNQVEGSAPVTPQLWRISFLDTADLEKTDRIQIGTRVFEIVGDVGLGTYSILNRVLCRQIV